MSYTTPWTEVRKKADEARARRRLPPRTDGDRAAAGRRLVARAGAAKLAELRRDQNFTQAAVAVEMGVSAPRVSAIERGDIDRTEVATLRAYVEALGGRLHVMAEFDGGPYRLA